MKTPVELRRLLHQTPELSFEEEQTASRIGEALTEAGIPWQPIARTGILARIEGRGDRSRAVVLRADIDALPIEERVEVAWRSQRPGVMHACGHDMHAAMLYGVLCSLREGDFEGTLFGLFQPGEECNPGGASLVLEENPFADYRVEAVIGQHVEPDLEVGHFGIRAGKYMAANDELRLWIEGQGGHGALRDRIQDTVSATARLVLQLTALNSSDRILSIGRVEALGATNVIPDTCYLEGTMRTFEEKDRNELKQTIETTIEAFRQEEQMACRLEIRPGYPPVVNDLQLAEEARRELLANGFAVEELTLRPTSEDFGWYATRYPSLFYRVGVGRHAGRTHTALFNPDEEAIQQGIEAMRLVALKKLNKQ